eukprot:SAG25_NODE_3037_length_1255_cov_1.642734_1_plen_67_part_10
MTALSFSFRGGDWRCVCAFLYRWLVCGRAARCRNVHEQLELDVVVVSKDFSSFAGYANALAEHFSAE